MSMCIAVIVMLISPGQSFLALARFCMTRFPDSKVSLSLLTTIFSPDQTLGNRCKKLFLSLGVSDRRPGQALGSTTKDANAGDATPMLPETSDV